MSGIRTGRGCKVTRRNLSSGDCGVAKAELLLINMKSCSQGKEVDNTSTKESHGTEMRVCFSYVLRTVTFPNTCCQGEDEGSSWEAGK